MNFSDKLTKLRKESGYTQSDLAEQLDVPKKEVVRWELGLAEPDRENLLRLSRLFGVPANELQQEVQPQQPKIQVRYSGRLAASGLQECKSSVELFGLPLYHIGENACGIFALGTKARGLIAVGLSAKGIVAVGMLARGILSLGLFSFGLVSIGVLSLGLLAAGAISAGILAAGAVAIGVISLGAVSIGAFSYGALALGYYYAVGDSAHGMIALGGSEAYGKLFGTCGLLTRNEILHIKDLLDANVPGFLNWAKEIAKYFLILIFD